MPPNKPGSKTRRRLIVLLVAMIVIVAGLAGIYVQLKRHFSPQRVTALAISTLEKLTGAEVEIASAKLSLLAGRITLANVQLRIPAEKLSDQGNFTAEDAVLFKSPLLQLSFARAGWFSRQFQLSDLLVEQPTFIVTQNITSDCWNWQMLLGPGGSKGKGWPGTASIELLDATVLFAEISSGQRKDRGQVSFSASAQPRDQDYHITVTTGSGPKARTVGRLVFNPRSGQIKSGHLDNIALHDLEPILPEPLRQWCRRLALGGTVGISEIQYAPAGNNWQVVLVLDNTSGQLPVSGEQWQQMDDPQANCWLNFSDLTGRISFRAREVIVESLEGKLNGAACQISGKYQGYQTNWDKMAFDLQIDCKQFTFPDYTDADQQQLIETHFPRKLRNFLADFKPRGKSDIQLSISKPGGSDKSLTLAGTLVPQGLSAEYVRFAYRIDDLVGQVTLRDGGFYLDRLEGISGQARCTITGFVSKPSRDAQIELQIHAQLLELDEKLYRALPSRYKGTWEAFGPVGTVNCSISLSRQAGPDSPWKRQIHVELLDVTASYKSFRYPLRHLAGIVEIDSQTLQIRSLMARHDSAQVSLTGSVEHLGQPNAQVDLAIRCDRVPVDSELLDALPTMVRQALEDCQFTGLVDLQGKIFTASSGETSYDLLCQFDNASLCYKNFPYPITGLAGQLHILPDQVEIQGAFARQGPAQIRAAGTVMMLKTAQSIDLTIDADNLPLDSKLYHALDRQEQKIWDLIQPVGTVNLTVKLKGDGGEKLQWQIDADLANGQLGYGQLPRLTDLHGKIHLEPGTAQLTKLTGKVGTGGSICISGELKSWESQLQGALQVQADNIALDQALLDWLEPTGLVKRLDIQPGGSIELDLDNLQFGSTPAGRRWDITGRIGLAGISARSITTEHTLDATYDGQITIDLAKDDFALDALLDLAKLRLGTRDLAKLSLRISKSLDKPMLVVREISGELCGGQLVGLAKLDLSSEPAQYALQVTFQDVPVGRCLIFRTTGPAIQGTFKGQIHLAGKLGQPATRSGGGYIEVSNTEILKIPFMAQLYKAINVEPPQLASFHDLTLKFMLDKQVADLSYIQLRGQAMSLLGYGTVNLSNDRLNLRLVASGPGRLDSLPLLDELLKGVAREISEIEVRGTVAEPRIKVVPLRRLTDTLQMFLEGKHAAPQGLRSF